MSAVWSERRVALERMAVGAGEDWPWLAEAVGAVGGGRLAQGAGAGSTPDRGSTIRDHWPSSEIDIISKAGEAIGFVAWRCGEEAQAGSGCALVIEAVSVRADRRNLGYGAEAVEALEARARARRSYAAVPRPNGLAVYFWLHTGYRPVRLDESAARACDPDLLWMVRELVG